MVAGRRRPGTPWPRPEGMNALAGLESFLYFFPSLCRAISQWLPYLSTQPRDFYTMLPGRSEFATPPGAGHTESHPQPLRTHSRRPGLSPHPLPVILGADAVWGLGFFNPGLPYLGQEEELELLPFPPPRTALPIF